MSRRVVLLVVLCSSGLCYLGLDSPASWPGSAGAADPVGKTESRQRLLGELKSYPHRLLHESYRRGNWDIYVCRADGREPRNLTRTPAVHEMYPQAAPDGGRIAFVADEVVDGKTVRSVYHMKADGSDRRLVARNARQPCWSPDGREIAYLKGEFRAFTVKDFATKGLMFHDVVTGKQRPHPNAKLHHLYNICWSANGRWILSTVHGGMGYGHAILAIEVDGQGVYDLKIGGCRPDLSRDGRKLCWGKDDHTISVADIDLEGPVPRLTNQRDIVKDELHVYHSEWSPDGRYVTFSRGPGGRMKANGPGTHRGLAEFVGVRAQWDLCIVPATGGSAWLELTHDGLSNKESEWIVRGSAAASP